MPSCKLAFRADCDSQTLSPAEQMVFALYNDLIVSLINTQDRTSLWAELSSACLLYCSGFVEGCLCALVRCITAIGCGFYSLYSSCFIPPSLSFQGCQNGLPPLTFSQRPPTRPLLLPSQLHEPTKGVTTIDSRRNLGKGMCAIAITLVSLYVPSILTYFFPKQSGELSHVVSIIYY